MPGNLGIFDHSGESANVGTSEKYAHYWQGDTADEQHYEQSRQGLMKVFDRNGLYLGPDQRKEGTVLWCGPGFNGAERDLNKPIIDTYIRGFREIVVTDFSRELLLNAGQGLAKSSRRIAGNVRLVRRDFTKGMLSTRFDLMVNEQLQNVRDAHTLREFMKWVEDTHLSEIEAFSLPETQYKSGLVDAGIQGMDDEEGLQFKNVLQHRKPIRLIIACSIGAGMFAVTEQAVREKMCQLYAEGTLDHDTFIDHLHTWQRLILELNMASSETFIANALKANEGIDESTTPIIYFPTDVTMECDGLGETFKRLQPDQIPLPEGIRLSEIQRWSLDDSHEEPDHNHTVSGVVIKKKNGCGDSDTKLLGDGADGNGGTEKCLLAINTSICVSI